MTSRWITDHRFWDAETPLTRNITLQGYFISTLGKYVAS